MRIAVAGGTGTVGRHVVNTVRAAGHEPLVLSRSRGADLTDGTGLDQALDGADVVVDVTNPDTIEPDAASRFFTAVAGGLQRAATKTRVRHVVTLSIVGIDDSPFGYYQAKLDHERAAADGTVPWTVLRATQLHELPAQLIGMTRHDAHASVFDALAQPVAARTVAEALVATAITEPQGRAPDLAGPERVNLVDMGRAFARRRGLGLTVDADTRTMSSLSSSALLPGNGATIAGPTYGEWLDTDGATFPV
jgi:uncharacterized protein YbjT (DUF2867 family)